MNIYEKLLNIQNELKAPKNQFNKFGNYKYRNAEDILEAVKPICLKYKAVINVYDTIKQIGDRYYVEATAVITDTENSENYIENRASAREEETKKGMDTSQVTGATSSYARKYALNGLLCIDDTKDTDSEEYQNQKKKSTKNEEVTPYDFEENKMTEEQLKTISSLERPLKEQLKTFYKKDPTQLTKLEAESAINSLIQKGLIKSEEQIEKEKKEKEEVF